MIDAARVAQLMTSGLQRFQAAAVDFALPPRCGWCGRCATVDPAMRSGTLCQRCRAELVPEGPQCDRCGAPVGPFLDTRSGCQHCRDEAFAFAAVLAVGAYRESLRSAILRMKRPGGDEAAHALTSVLCDRFADRLRGWALDLVVPVPDYWIERCCRRHSPASTIADVIGRFLLVPVMRHILRKRCRTRSQASLPPSRRRLNLKDAFQIAGGARLDGAAVLLVDDVLTTGTTADRASKILLAAGARSVHVAVIARGIGTSVS